MLRVGIVEETGGFFLRRGRTLALREVERSFYLLFDGLVTHQGNKENKFCRKGNIKQSDNYSKTPELYPQLKYQQTDPDSMHEKASRAC